MNLYPEITEQDYNQMMHELQEEYDVHRRQQEDQTVKIGAAFPSKYLRALDIGRETFVLTIDSVKMEDVGRDDDKEVKPVVTFHGAKAGLVLNRTNGDAIAKIAGTDETDEWGGVRVELFTMEVMAFGQMVDAVRVRAPRASKPARPEPEVPAEPSRMSAEDDIPF